MFQPLSTAAVMTSLFSVHTHTLFDWPYGPEYDVVPSLIAAAPELRPEYTWVGSALQLMALSGGRVLGEMNLQMLHLSANIHQSKQKVAEQTENAATGK